MKPYTGGDGGQDEAGSPNATDAPGSTRGSTAPEGTGGIAATGGKTGGGGAGGAIAGGTIAGGTIAGGGTGGGGAGGAIAGGTIAGGTISGGTIAGGTISGGGTGGSGGDAGVPDAPAAQPDVSVGGSGGSGTSTGGRGGTGGGGESTIGPGPDCLALAGLTNGSVSVPTRTPGSTATYSCNTGYKLSGAATRTCQSDGIWSGTTPTCALVNCDAPPSTANGSVSAPTTTYGSTATYSCAVGYNLSGTATLTCQTDGTWSGTVPSCALVDCHAPPGLRNGSASAPSTTYGSTATYSCVVGSNLSGTATRTCQADGTWSGTAPSCPPVDCHTPPGTPNGSVSAPSTAYGSTATYSCVVGYNLSGTATRTCQTDGTWSGTVPTCTLVDCHAPPSTASGSVIAPLTTYGSTATYSCAVGYSLSGTATRTCQANGTWGGTTPTCVLADCGPLSSPTHGSVSAPTTTFGSVATYSCDSGYAITGVTTRSCQANETWSDAVPTCSIQMLTVTINKIGAGTGTVTSTPAGISCGSTCQATYAYGTAVTLSAAPDANQYFMGWDSTACTGTGICAFTLTSNTVVRASFSPPPNIVFTTSTTQTPALGGLAGADAICAQRALAAGLTGTYRAWLSTSTVNAIDRLGSASGWVRPDGKPVLNSIGDIAQNKLFYPPRLDEFGNDLGADPPVMTATGWDGTLSAGTNLTTCGDFTSDVDDGNYLWTGYASCNSLTLTDGTGARCSVFARIYCFGIDHTAQVAVTPVAGRRAFMTVAFWTPGGGIGAADAFCQSEATTAKLPGTYKALLAPSGASAASRFNVSGAPWISYDGMPLAATASAFFSANVLDVTPIVTADGSSRCGTCALWSGAATMTTVGSDTTTCANWLSTSGTGAIGDAGDTSVSVFFGEFASFPCSASAKLTCLQE